MKKYDNDRLMKYKEFYDEIHKKVKKYKKTISTIGFGLPEVDKLSKLEEDITGTINAVEVIINSSLELNHIFESSPDSIYVTDGEGITLRVNKAFEESAISKRQEVMRENVYDLERRGVFKPSVCGLILKEKRKISILQNMDSGKKTVVTGVPIFDERYQIYRVVTNTKLLEEVIGLTQYIKITEQNHQSADESNKGEQTLIAESQSMKAILDTIRQVSDVDSTILIIGESGVGKGVIARYIHKNSKRSGGKLVEINCGAIPENLLESELFGYESGAFTGANRKGKPGLIEMANKGTLFLDEISELPLMVQVKLLHFLQNRKITRVGGTEEIEVDLRVIAASNKDLEKQVEKGNFRLDLFYRLHVIPIIVPPLRDRLEDIEPAVKYFAEKYKKKYNKDFTITQEFINYVKSYHWPGNMRQLENHIERTIVTNKENYALDNNRHPKEIKKGNDDHISINVDGINSLNEEIEKLEKKIIKAAFEKHKSSYKVAQALGLSQATAYRKILKYVPEKQNMD